MRQRWGMQSGSKGALVTVAAVVAAALTYFGALTIIGLYLTRFRRHYLQILQVSANPQGKRWPAIN